MKTPQFEIGYQFIRRGVKNKRVETIVDILTTTNMAGEVIKIEYVSEHDFMNQTIKVAYLGTTIAMSEKV